MPTIFERLQHGWNAFRGRDRPVYDHSVTTSYRHPDQVHVRFGNERSIITSICNRMAMDVASHKIEHVKVDENGRYSEIVYDGLNGCLTLEANIDQTARAFIQDVVITMFEEGDVAIVPIDTTIDPNVSSSFDIQSMRVGSIIQWLPQHVKVRVYNEWTGRKEEIFVPKRSTAIIHNPFYIVMNEPNSTLQRLIRKLNILDAIDEQSGAGKLDLIIQLPYTIKSPMRREQAENRRKDVEMQLAGSKYGIAYTDATEKITQLNRPVENNLMNQIEYLMNTLYSQLTITPEIMNGTASETVMLNYNTRTIEPVLSAIVDEMKRKFLTKTARTQGHSIMFATDPFKLVPSSTIADIAEKFVGNEVLTPNEVRSIIGFKPSNDAQADELRNRRLSPEGGMGEEMMPYEYDQNGSEQQEYYDDETAGDMNSIGTIPISYVNQFVAQLQEPEPGGNSNV